MKMIEEIYQKFGVRPNHCLVNYMMNGTDHYLPMHQDQPFSKGAKRVEHKDSVYIVTLGEPRPLVFGVLGDLGKKEQSELTGFIASVSSCHGDLYELRGNLNTQVTHGILKDAKIVNPRVSLTFRLVKHSIINKATEKVSGPGAAPVDPRAHIEVAAKPTNPIEQVSESSEQVG